MTTSGIAYSILWEMYTRDDFEYLYIFLNLEVHSIVDNWNWSDMSIDSFWKVISFNIGSIDFIAEKIFLCAFRIFRLLLPLEGDSWNVTKVVIVFLIMTTVVTVAIARCVIMLFASGIISESFNTTILICGFCFRSFFLRILLRFRWMVEFCWKFQRWRSSF